MAFRYILIVLIMITLLGTVFSRLEAQSYHALNGSAYSGVLSNFVNPASSVNTPFQMDYSIFGFQTNNSNNGIVVKNLTKANLTPKNINNITYQPTIGSGSRTIDDNSDVHLFNIRYSLDEIQSVNFGMRLRTYNHIWASPFDYNPTIRDFNSFLSYNSGNSSRPFNMNVINAAWAETNFGYSRILTDNEDYRLSVGGTLQILRGLSGVGLALNDVTYQSLPNRNVITSASMTSIYSANYSAMDTQYSAMQNLHRFRAAAKFGIGASIGVEYIVKKNVFDEPYSPQNYYWKFGASIMDIGSNNFNTIQYSFNVNTPKNGLTDTAIINRLHSPYDSVSNLTNILWQTFDKGSHLKSTNSKFKISLPTRLVLTVDKSLGNDFYVNLMGNINFYSQEITNAFRMKTADLNRLILTTRWETDKWGIYIPLEYTENNKILIGGAVKLGPLVVGLHNINWLQHSRLEEFEGGGYLALHFTPSLKKRHHYLDCFDGTYSDKSE